LLIQKDVPVRGLGATRARMEYSNFEPNSCDPLHWKFDVHCSV